MKKILSFAALLLLLFLIQSLVGSIVKQWQSKDVVKVQAQILEREKQENARLKAQLAEAQSPQFLEEQARDKLFMLKSGEGRIILPESSASAQNVSQEAPKSNIAQWFDLFFSTD